ncbi:TetR/AcrR family transcriptional regulator [Nocardia wallacei]|uniref:TetR/AcrR family transcriptional regulator n=1 Tax=Nocardia wallacei TaxID=480035 RepID=UPI002454B325|nr:TetR family transcriptional regulator [Nocardia wallacei]
MTRPARRARDPEGRRRAIIEAAVRVIAERGVAGVTHRRVAEVAGVPVGSTTYYFKDLDELIRLGLRHAANVSVRALQQWNQDLATTDDLAATLAGFVAETVADVDRHRSLNELYAAAAHRPELRPLARLWSDGLGEVLAPRVGPRAARAIAVYLDGILVHALVTDDPVDIDTLTAGVTAIAALRD